MNSPPFERVRGVDPDVLDAGDLDGLTADIAACQSWLAALQVRVTRAQRRLADEGRATDPRSSLADHGKQSGRDALAASERETVCTAMPAVEDALATGGMSTGHVDAIAKATSGLDDQTLAEFNALADDLVADAGRQRVDAFARSCRDLARRLQNRNVPGSDAAELERQHRASKVSRWVDRQTGMHKTLIEVDPVTDREFWSAVQRQRGLLRQRTTNRQTSWHRLTVDAIVTAAGNGVGDTRPGSGNLLVLIDLDSLIHGGHDRTVCETDSGVALPVATARRLACDAGLIPVVLSGDGVVLDEGRARRLATRAQRAAIAAMHRTCVYPGCEVTVDDCRVHHTTEWTRDRGETNLDDLAPVCETHHHEVHEGGWQLELDADRIATWTRPDGTVHWRGPAIDRVLATALRAGTPVTPSDPLSPGPQRPGGSDATLRASGRPDGGRTGSLRSRLMTAAPEHKIHLAESEMPTTWYNIIPDLPAPPPPPLHPGTHEPVGPDDLAPLFPMALIEQEVSTDRFIEIPGEVLDVYRVWRPSPLFRATRLEQALGTPARIYYKYEGVSPAGSHKPNTSVPQAYYNHAEGVTKLTTETGAGQWGSALAYATAQYGIECEVWMVAASYLQKPYRRTMMEVWGATVHSSPSDVTDYGRQLLAENPEHTGSLGIAISEAVAACVGDPNSRYALGSVLNHVLLHQTIIGEEALLQLAKVGETPDVLVGCTGGGSNFGGLAFPFMREKLAGRMDPIIRCVEPAACPTLTKGEYRYDFGDTAGMTPLMKMHTLGHGFVPEPIHAGGLRYHGMSPLVSHIYELGLAEAVAIPQRECFAGAVQFARNEGILPAPEPTHAIAAAIREALACKESGEEKVILTAMCGHGHLDLAAYEKYLSGEMVDYELSTDQIDAAMAEVPVLT